MLELIEVRTPLGMRTLARLDGALIELEDLPHNRDAIRLLMYWRRRNRAANVARAVEAKARSAASKTSPTRQEESTASETIPRRYWKREQLLREAFPLDSATESELFRMSLINLQFQADPLRRR